MNLITKLGVVTLAAVTVAPLASTVAPVTAQAKTVKKSSKKKAKAYKISKNILKSHKKVMVKLETKSRRGMVLLQTSKKNLRIICNFSSETSHINYKIKKQTVKGSTMTLKLTPKLSKADIKYGFAKGSGTIKLVRKGKNSYTIPTIYASDQYRINGHKYQNYNMWQKPKKVSVKKLQVMSLAKLKSIRGLFASDYKF